MVTTWRSTSSAKDGMRTTVWSTLLGAFSTRSTWLMTRPSRRGVETTGQQPTFKLGDRVRFEHHGRQRPVDGEVTKIDAARAKYVVYCASLGHVREGVGSHGIFVDFERVTAASA